MVYGIGNPLMDVVIQAEDADLPALGLDKGIMHLVTEGEQARFLDYFAERPRTYLKDADDLRILKSRLEAGWAYWLRKASPALCLWARG